MFGTVSFDPHPYPLPTRGRGICRACRVMPMTPSTIEPRTIGLARAFRRDMTLGERKLWNELRELRRLHGVHVRRQAPIGPYIADFSVHSEKLVIEVDGHHHLHSRTAARDRTRDAWLKTQGYRILRFSTAEIDEAFDGCVEEILRELGIA
ncbi:endonuclease domain-containing protein [Afifella aestuarii]|uniref:endonuclease domain-containing protein n=1 Tax=Afifella aestuarii TaxID=1909496 RepID=UPI001FEA35C4|nr:DUF559 domain-containing protein [Afifella aestuarii]